MKILVLEASTSSGKAMLYDTETTAFRVESIAYKNTRGGAEYGVPAQEVMHSVFEAGRRVTGTDADVSAIALVSAWHSLLYCDETMMPLTPVLYWDDTRPAAYCASLRKDKAFTDTYYHRTGCMVNVTYPVFRAAYLEAEQPALRTGQMVSQGTYLTYILTGKRVSTRCMSSGSGLLNIHEKEYDRETLAQFGMDANRLSPLTDSACALLLTKDAARQLGLKEGIPVYPANSDGAMNQVGVGALKEGIMTFSVGTSGAIRFATPKPKIPKEPSTWCYLSPKGWLSGAATNGCCNCIDYAKETLFGSGVTYDEMERGVSFDSETPVFLPLLFGERCPGWDDTPRGGFVEDGRKYSPQQKYLAVQEGVLFHLYQCYEVLRQLNGTPDRILLSGGITHSPRWLQMCADVFDAPMQLTDASQASLMGGAVLAMEQQGVIADITDYAPVVTKTILPSGMHAHYRDKYKRFRVAYQNSYSKLGDITCVTDI